MLLAADPNFNADFYVVAATVIPIFLVLIVLQLGLLRSAVETFVNVIARKGRLWRALIVIWVTNVIVGLGALAEIVAIGALWTRDSGGAGGFVLGVTLALIALAAIAVMYAWMYGSWTLRMTQRRTKAAAMYRRRIRGEHATRQRAAGYARMRPAKRYRLR
jgi:hypothetical protein